MLISLYYYFHEYSIYSLLSFRNVEIRLKFRTSIKLIPITYFHFLFDLTHFPYTSKNVDLTYNTFTHKKTPFNGVSLLIR